MSFFGFWGDSGLLDFIAGLGDRELLSGEENLLIWRDSLLRDLCCLAIGLLDLLRWFRC
jgi:hypothetical protein